ncbi:MAG: GNAT family N-acetyltransferase [Oscillospiraceae bacterium]|jgi:RimJ/RimL family protein N-acetyltransferase|nr:GNAT family N-acetyltransferase [Oscillospiraceae bacterium]
MKTGSERMTIRRSRAADLPAILEIYDAAREFMAASGNPTQWTGGYPDMMAEGDCAPGGHGYVCEGGGGELLAAFYFNIEQDSTYAYIEGAWLNDEPYGVVHRIAVKRGTRGVGEFCLRWAFEQCGNLRIDTHTDNAPMRSLLGKLGFAYCGTIWVLDGAEERIAFQKSGIGEQV